MRRALPLILGLSLAGAAAVAAPGLTEPIAPVDGRALILPEALGFDARAQRFVVQLGPDSEAAQRPVLPPDDTSAAARLLRGWLAEGRAAGLAGVFYDNRDRGHSQLSAARFPQLVHLEYAPEIRAQNLDVGLAGPFLFNAPVLGNSSTAVTAGAGARGLPRLAMTSRDGPGRAAQTALADHLYVYPAWRDHDTLDLLPANWAYMVASQGASYSDAPFLDALALTLAAFTPETRAAMMRDRLLVPTLQMILRRNLAGITTPEAYLSGRAHPVVFDGARLRPELMMAMANRLTPETLPPRVSLRIEAEDFYEAAGLAGLDERLFDTPEAIARIWRGFDGRRSLRLAAQAQPDGRAARFDWVLLQGDPALVQITPLDPRGLRAEVTIDWHGRRPASPRSERATDRVDIAVFAWNGHHHSAPAFLTVAFPGHELRHHVAGPDGVPRLVWVDYDAQRRGAAFDPWLHFSAPWRDVAIRAPDGTLAGWRRETPEGGLELDAAGHLSDGRRVHYLLDEGGAQGARLLRMDIR